MTPALCGFCAWESACLSLSSNCLQILPNAGLAPAFLLVREPRDDALRYHVACASRRVSGPIGHEAPVDPPGENLNYSARGLAAIGDSATQRDGQPNALAQRLARNPGPSPTTPPVAQRNGDEAGGSPATAGRYRRRGLLQIGPPVENYRAAAPGGPAAQQEPELSEQPRISRAVAAWWWASHGSNDLADRGDSPHHSRSTAARTARRSAWRCGSGRRGCCRDLRPALSVALASCYCLASAPPAVSGTGARALPAQLDAGAADLVACRRRQGGLEDAVAEHVRQMPRCVRLRAARPGCAQAVIGDGSSRGAVCRSPAPGTWRTAGGQWRPRGGFHYQSWVYQVVLMLVWARGGCAARSS